jgi:hypothetical protein
MTIRILAKIEKEQIKSSDEKSEIIIPDNDG